MSDVTILATGFGFPEGPVVCQDGSIILTEIRNARLSRVAPDGANNVFSCCGGGPNGLAFGPDGALYLCNNGGGKYVEGYSMSIGPHPDYKFGYIQRIDMKTGEAKTLYSEVEGHSLSAPNDVVFDTHGGFYFTDLGKRHARHRGHDAGRIIAGLPGNARFDSLAVMASGNIALATLHTGCITEISAAGDIVRTVKMPDIYPTNICFGGPDMRTAYITLSDSGRLATMQWPEPGLKLNYG